MKQPVDGICRRIVGPLLLVVLGLTIVLGYVGEGVFTVFLGTPCDREIYYLTFALIGLAIVLFIETIRWVDKLSCSHRKRIGTFALSIIGNVVLCHLIFWSSDRSNFRQWLKQPIPQGIQVDNTCGFAWMESIFASVNMSIKSDEGLATLTRGFARREITEIHDTPCKLDAKDLLAEADAELFREVSTMPRPLSCLVVSRSRKRVFWCFPC